VEEIIPIEIDAPDNAAVRRAAEVLREGNVIALPTDTIWGLCSKAGNSAGIEKLYEAKGRRDEKGAPVLIGQLDQLALLTKPLHEKIWEKLYILWPGPLTLIFEAGEETPPLLAEGGGIAVRYPGQPLCQTLARAAGPFAATSANPPGEAPFASAAEIAARFGDKISLILDGGSIEGGAPSTVVDLRGTSPKLIREGAFDFDKVIRAWEDD
jgi:L-threonylcarbamoyladenylate synthase